MNTTHPFASYPKPNIPLGYGQLNSKKAYKQLWDKGDAEYILEHMSITHVDNISTWFDLESGKYVITVIADHESEVWIELYGVLENLQVIRGE